MRERMFPVICHAKEHVLEKKKDSTLSIFRPVDHFSRPTACRYALKILKLTYL